MLALDDDTAIKLGKNDIHTSCVYFLSFRRQLSRVFFQERRNCCCCCSSFSSCACFDSCSFHPEPQQAWMKLTKFYLQEMKRKDSKGTPTSQEKKGEWRKVEEEEEDPFLLYRGGQNTIHQKGKKKDARNASKENVHSKKYVARILRHWISMILWSAPSSEWIDRSILFSYVFRERERETSKNWLFLRTFVCIKD